MKTKEEKKRPESAAKRPKRRWWIKLIIVLAVVCVLWKVAEYLINIDNYKPMIVSAIEDATGLPVSIDDLDLDIMPTPRVQAIGITVGEKDFKANIGVITVFVELASLFKDSLRITEIQISDLKVTLPTDLAEVPKRIEPISEKMNEPKADSGVTNEPYSEIRLDRIICDKATVYQGENAKEPILECTIEATDVLSDTISVDLSASSSLLGPKAVIESSLAYIVENSGLSGKVTISGVDTASLPIDMQLPAVSLSADLTLEGTLPDAVNVEIAGNIESEILTSLAGKYSASVRYDAGTFAVEDIALDLRGLTLEGMVSRNEDASMAYIIKEARANSESLGALAVMFKSDSVGFAVKPDASLQLKDILVRQSADVPLRLALGQASLEGIDANLMGYTGLLKNIRAQIHVENDVVLIDSLECDGIRTSGSVALNLLEQTAVLEMVAKADLTEQHLNLLVPDSPVTKMTIPISIDSIHATLGKDDGIPSDLAVKGKIDQGSITLNLPTFQESIHPISAAFSVLPSGADISLSAASERFSEINWSGHFNLENMELSGNLQADLEKIGLSFMPDEDTKEMLAPLLASYGRSDFAIDLKLASESSPRTELKLARKGTPRLEASATVTDAALDGFSVSTDVAPGLFQAMLPSDLEPSGLAKVDFEHSAKDNSFVAKADLTPCAVLLGEYVHKRTGGKLDVEITGSTLGGEWKPQALSVDCLGEVIEGRLQGAGVFIDQLDLNLTPLSSLLTNEAKISGRLHGSVSTEPMAVNMTFDNAGFALTEELAIDSINGSVIYENDILTCRNLTLKGANSDCTITAGLKNDAWSGQLTGNKLDVNSLLAIMATASSLSTDEAEPEETKEESKPLTGNFDIKVASLYYGRGRADNVRANVTLTPEKILVRDIFLKPYTGSATGTVDITNAKGDEPMRVAVDLLLDEIDTKFIDDALLEQAQGLKGTLSGTVKLDMPLPEEGDPMAGANGSIVLKAHDGTLGKFGLATKLLSVLKATDIFRLKIPKMSDEGLVYNKCSTSMTIKNGVLTLASFSQESDHLTLEAAGKVDFPRDNMDLQIKANVLEGVTGLVDKVPILRDAAGAVNRHAGMNLTATGSISSPSVRPQAGKRIKGIKESTTGALQKLFGR